ncbi:MAG: hypothetical protein Q9163_004738 [Psora crenata]
MRITHKPPSRRVHLANVTKDLPVARLEAPVAMTPLTIQATMTSKPAYVKPKGSLVFFSNVDPTDAYKFSQTLSRPGAILRGAFLKAFVSRSKRSDEWLQDFFDRASGFFADKAVEAGDPVYFVGMPNAEVKP